MLNLLLLNYYNILKNSIRIFLPGFLLQFFLILDMYVKMFHKKLYIPLDL